MPWRHQDASDHVRYKELHRINVILSVVEKRMRRRDAAHQRALTERQTQRLMNRFRDSGTAGLANLRQRRPGNHRLPESLKLRVHLCIAGYNLEKQFMIYELPCDSYS